MSKHFEISGYWKGDETEFSGLIVKEFDDINEETDDLIFFYGMNENDIKDAIKEGRETMEDFIIESYQEIKL